MRASVDGTLIQAWAGHKSFVREDGDDADDSGGDFKGHQRSNETHESKTDPDSKLYRKGKTGSELRYMEPRSQTTVMDWSSSPWSRGADGFAEREAANVMIGTHAKRSRM
ncbi:hypothetical protein FB547_110235 [Variovorax beijingensis]|uniref:Uncharacterized protein n=1 Tax=Variovorax beijingensis TaxID=2496117 RepID=A0A561BEH7_9BURK|nr:hypothetical protein FB547_110235 [Variovorax beijingensis]